MQGEPQSSSAIGGKQQIVVTGLKTIHHSLAFPWLQTTCQQLTADALLQQLQRTDKTTEQHNRLLLRTKAQQQLFRLRQFEFSTNPP